jgi:sugar fermentation stimulation protein A
VILPVLLEKQGLIQATLLLRHKRFLAEVRLEDGTETTAHCTNTGTMMTCWEPGDLVLLEPADKPERKLKFTWLACRRDGTWVGVDTGLPNRVVAEAARRDALPGLPGLHSVRTEVRYGEENSRIDVLAQDAMGNQVFIEVKNTTLRRGSCGCFPDAVTERGAKHLRELRHMVGLGHRSAIVYFVQRADVATFSAAADIDPRYAEELLRAAEAGVTVLPLRVDLQASQGLDGRWSLKWSLPGVLPWLRGPGGPEGL